MNERLRDKHYASDKEVGAAKKKLKEHSTEFYKLVIHGLIQSWNLFFFFLCVHGSAFLCMYVLDKYINIDDILYI